MTLQDIQQSFSTQAFGLTGATLVGLAITLLLLALILSYLIYRFVRKKEAYSPLGHLIDPQLIHSLIEQAFLQRSPFELQFYADGPIRRPTLRCTPESLNAETLTIEANGVDMHADTWVNKRVSVYFRVKRQNQFIYYTFDTEILSTLPLYKDYSQIILPFPKSLSNRQKRAFLRIVPPYDLLLGGAIWFDTNMPSTDALNDLAMWPRPSLLLLPGKFEQFRFINISAGGIRLCLPRQTVRDYKIKFTTVDHLVILVDLLDPEQNEQMRFWLSCRVQNIWEDYDTRDVHLGLQFLAWAKAKNSPEASPGALDWLRLSATAEIESIGNWVMRRHLEFFRETSEELSI